MNFTDVSLADVSAYWNRQPCNVRHSNAPLGSLRFSREVTKRKYFVEPHIREFAEFDRWDGKKVVEIGCGIGTDTISFMRSGAAVFACDLSNESLAIASQRFKVEHKDAPFMGALGCLEAHNAEDPFSLIYHGADLIYSFGVLHHTPHPDRAFEQIWRMADEHTHIKLMMYNRASAKVLALTKGRIWDDEAIARQSEAQTGCPVTYSYTPLGVRETLAPWFHVDRVRVAHIFPYKLGPYRNYEYRKHWWAKLPGFDYAETLLGWHLLIDARKKGK